MNLTESDLSWCAESRKVLVKGSSPPPRTKMKWMSESRRRFRRSAAVEASGGPCQFTTKLNSSKQVTHSLPSLPFRLSPSPTIVEPNFLLTSYKAIRLTRPLIFLAALVIFEYLPRLCRDFACSLNLVQYACLGIGIFSSSHSVMTI